MATETVGFQALCRLSLGEAQLLAGRLEEAHALAERALALAREHQERGNQAYALRLLGEIAAQREPPEVEQAEAHYRQALALAEELGMRPLQAHCHRGLGTLYAQTGQREQARAELSTAIELYRAMDDDLLAAPDRGGAGAGGGAMIMGSAIWPRRVTFAQNWHTRRPSMPRYACSFLRFERPRYINLWPLAVMGMRVSPRSSACVQGVLARLRLLVQVYGPRVSVGFSHHGALALYRHTCLVYTALASTAYGFAWWTRGERTSGAWRRSHTRRQVPSVRGMARSRRLLERVWWCDPCGHHGSRMRWPLGRPVRALAGDRQRVRLQTAGGLGVTKRPICCRHIKRHLQRYGI